MILPTTATRYGVFRTRNASGELANADALPTVALRRNGATDATAVTVTNLSAGTYAYSFSCAGFAAGDQIIEMIAATVDGLGATEDRMDLLIGAVMSEVTAIKAKTDGLPASTANDLTNLGTALSTVNTSVTAVPAAVWASAIEGVHTATHAMRLILAAVINKTTGGQTHFRDIADTKDRIVGTIDSNGDRVVTTRDGT